MRLCAFIIVVDEGDCVIPVIGEVFMSWLVEEYVSVFLSDVGRRVLCGLAKFRMDSLGVFVICSFGSKEGRVGVNAFVMSASKEIYFIAEVVIKEMFRVFVVISF